MRQCSLDAPEASINITRSRHLKQFAKMLMCRGFLRAAGGMPAENQAARGPHIRSGGQTGVDRAALDAAVAAGFRYEGWCPKGGFAEDFAEPPGLIANYPCLKETPKSDPKQRTEWNVRDSAVTVVLVPHGQFCSPGTDFTIACAKKLRKPYTVIHYLDTQAQEQLTHIIASLNEDVSVNIAGPRESEHNGAYALCSPLLTRAFGAMRGANST
jgi:Circularly permutated YpsA SLOG family